MPSSFCRQMKRRPMLPIMIAILVSIISQSTRGAEPAFTVEVHGAGHPVILIPGLTCEGAVWDDTVAHLERRYQCHVLSLAGFGQTPPTDPGESYLATVKTALEAYLESEALERPILVGHSLGGFLALWLGSELGDRFGGLVIVDGLPFFPAAMNPAATVETGRAIARQMEAQFANQSPEQALATQRMMLRSMITDPAKIELAAQWGVQSDRATVGRAMAEMYSTDLRADLARVTAPTLVLGAWVGYQAYGATRASTEAIYRAQFAQLPEYTFAMTDTGRHFIMWDDPEFFLGQLDAFLAGLPGAAAEER